MSAFHAIAMSRMLILTVALLALAPLGFAQEPEVNRAVPAPPIASGNEGPPPVVMGFVDMEKIIESHPETKQRTEQLQLELRASLDALKQQADRMRAMEDGLALLKEGSPEYMEQLKRINMLKATLELDQKILRMKTNLDLVGAMKDIYQRCRGVVQKVAAERGFHVIAMYSSSEVDGRTRNELIGDIVTRPFIYHHPSLDITEDVVRELTR